MIALLKSEKWKTKCRSTVFCYCDCCKDNPFRVHRFDGLSSAINGWYDYCDGKTLWTKVEDKTELDLMKEKYASGDYIIICKNPNPIANQTSIWFLHTEGHLGAYKPFEADHLQHKLIHKNHKDILEACLADNSVPITWGLGGVVLTGKAFIEEYDESFEYLLKPKKKTISLAMFTCQWENGKGEQPNICKSLEDFKSNYNNLNVINHHEIPNTRYEQEIDE